jgi:hypothetical protein
MIISIATISGHKVRSNYPRQRVINVKTSCGADKQLVFDSRTPPPIPELPPVPFEQREEVTLHFYPPVDTEDDKEFDSVRQICKTYRKSFFIKKYFL